jgi:hypothetical protein
MESHLVVCQGHIETNVPRSAARAIFRANRQSESVRTYTVRRSEGGRAEFVTANGLRIVSAGGRQ